METRPENMLKMTKDEENNTESQYSNSADDGHNFVGSRRKEEKETKNHPNSDQNGLNNNCGTKTDAGFNNPAISEIGDTPKTGLMVTDPHAEEYKMCHEKRGKAVIFNHKYYDNDEKGKLTREGTEFDVDRIKHVFGEILKFDVEVHNDLTLSEILTQIQKLAKDDYKDCDCIAIFILTHGNKGGALLAKDIGYYVDILWDCFTNDKCNTLAGKPKLFFVNACRGEQKDRGTRLKRDRTQTDNSKSMMTYKIPNQADILMANSTVEGYPSYREELTGSWFIECLCNVIKEYHERKDLLNMLTIVQRKVAIDYRTRADKLEDHDLTQVPSIMTTLIRDVYFRSK